MKCINQAEYVVLFKQMHKSFATACGYAGRDYRAIQ